jgi:ankyrin repeat protein
VSTLDNFKKEAKRWLAAIRSGDAGARARLRAAHPTAPDVPALRHIQHALAREHGFDSWLALKTRHTTHADPGHAERVAKFLTFSCWDHHVHGKGDHRMYDRAAQRLLSQHPEIAHDSLYTAIVCGDIREVERILSERPEAASEAGGSRGWPPILYLCFTRFTHAPTIANALGIARTLLDRGADPNAYYKAGDANYSALVGVAGEGEQDSPRQPQARALFQLLLERGAKPFDIQVLYNTHFSCDMIWWLDLVYEYTVAQGRKDAWDDPNWSMLDMGGYGPGAYFILNAAIASNDLRLAEWALQHGAGVDARRSSHPKFKPKLTHYERATLEGLTDMADLLARHGASRTPPALNPALSDAEAAEGAFVAACLRLDRDFVRVQLEQHPEYLRSPKAIFIAAQRDRADVVAFLLDLGVPLEIEDDYKQRTLHEAASHNALRVAKLLIERGAEIDPRETQWNATPIGFASYGDKIEMVDLLSRFSKNVWTLAYRGYVDRLRDVLQAEPALATVTSSEGTTPLWWLPDDDAKAIEIATLLMAHGADPSARSKDGETAADSALERGMLEVARLLAVDGAPTAPRRRSPRLQPFEDLAQALLFAFETGHPASMQRLQEYTRTSFTWDELRADARARLAALGEAERPDGYFALPHARLLVARQAGYENWEALAKACS